VSTIARLRRAYFDCRYGQLHVHQAIPPGGGFDEAAPLLCIPGRQGTGRFFEALLGPLGADRSIYAPDLPGCGESDSAGAAAGSQQYALALTDLLDSLRQRQVDILAHAEGVDTAVAIEKLRPHALVRRVACLNGSAQALATVRGLKIEFRELSLDVAAAEVPQIGSLGAQLSDLIEFFGSVSKV
jgi:pimeloyl-ACP methyl ester carboxylesterase